MPATEAHFTKTDLTEPYFPQSTMARPSPRFRILLAAIALSVVVAGCTTTPDDRGAKREAADLINFAEKAEREGSYEAAGNAYRQLALITPREQRTGFQIKAVNQLLAGNYIAQAKRALQLTSHGEATPAQQLDLRLLAARIALAEGDPVGTLDHLQQPPSAFASNAQRAQYHWLRAQAYSRAGNLIEAIREYVSREPFLAAPLDAPPEEVEQRIEENQLLIWQSLTMLSDEVLEQLRIEPPPNPLSGWLEFALLARQAQRSDGGLDLTQSLETWRSRYPDLQVSENLFAAITALQSDGMFHPRKIALLLPMSGNFAKAAAVIRDGFLAAHFDDSQRDEPPTIRIYDTAANGKTTSGLYQQAVDDGAEFIVGPLSKAGVDALIEQESATVPTLTLNYGTDASQIADNLFQFGLSPEDEARQLAERAWLDGYNQALAIVPEGEWGARILNAFTDSWEALNGTVVEHQSYASSNNDFSGPLRNMLNIDESEQRKKELQRLLGTKLKFEPRRRQDADFVFMVAFPRQARLIKPQLKFHYASDLPVYATSHIYSGIADRDANRDLDEVTFCDIPWVLNSSRGSTHLSQRIRKLWPDESNQYTRFYALGIDAYNLIPHIKHMATFRYERHNGETGSLSLDESNRIFRTLPWARFRRGIARPL